MIGDPTARIFGGMPELIGLDMSGTAITDNGVEFLSASRSVRGVDLSNTQITNKAIAHLSKSESIQGGGFRGTNLTDAAIGHLLEIIKRPDFNALDLRDTKISAAGLKRLWEAVPYCRAQWTSGWSIEPPDPEWVEELKRADAMRFFP